MSRCYLCNRKESSGFLHQEIPCQEHRNKHAQRCLKAGIECYFTGGIFDMFAYEALAAAITYSDYRNPTSLWWFARLCLDIGTRKHEKAAMNCLIVISDMSKPKWLGESERSLTKWQKLVVIVIKIIEQNGKKGKKTCDIEDFDKKSYHAVKRKYGKSWSPIGGVFRKK